MTVLGSGVVGDKKNNILGKMRRSSSFPGRLLNYEAAEKNGKISQTFGCHEEMGILERLKGRTQENTVRTWRPIATVSEQRVLYYTHVHAYTRRRNVWKPRKNTKLPRSSTCSIVRTQNLTCQTTDELILHTVSKD